MLNLSGVDCCFGLTLPENENTVLTCLNLAVNVGVSSSLFVFASNL